jgi:uncharacterized protein (DUF1810 family)
MTAPLEYSEARAPDLGRFTTAQDPIYKQVLAELRAGAKRSHWMWFVFPQVAGLGFSSTSQYYGIRSAVEARAYLVDPLLGSRLVECTEAVLATERQSARQIFGPVDALKFRSCMTLFSAVADTPSVFQRALDKYFAGESDARTLEILAG